VADAFDDAALAELTKLNETMAQFVKTVSGGKTTGIGSSNDKKLSKEDKAIRDALKKRVDLEIIVIKEDQKKIKQAKEINKLSAESIDLRKDLTKAEKDHIKEHGSLMKQAGLGMVELPGKIGKSISSKFSKSLGPASGAFDALAATSPKAAIGIASLGVVAGAAYGKLMNMIDTFGDVSKSGVRMEGGIGGTIQASANLNMSLSKFAEMTTQYTRTMNKVGIKGFTKTVSTMSTGMRQFGYTTSESAEFLAGYLETQRMQGVLGQQSEAQRASSAKELMKQTDELSVAFGTSKDEILSGLNKAYDDPQIKATLRSLPQEAQKAFRKSQVFLNAASPALASSVAEMVGSAVPTMTSSFQTAVQAGVPGVATAMQEYAQKIKDGTETEADRRKMLQKMAHADVGILRIQAAAGNASAQAMLSQVMAAKEAEEQYATETPAEAKKRRLDQETAAAVKTVREQFAVFGDKVMAGLLVAFPGGVENLTKKIGLLATWVGEKLIPGIIDFAKWIGSAISYMSRMPWGLIASSLTLLGGAKLLSMIGGTKSINAGIVNVFGKSMGKGSKGSKGSKGGKGKVRYDEKARRYRGANGQFTKTTKGAKLLQSAKTSKAGGVLGSLMSKIGMGLDAAGKGGSTLTSKLAKISGKFPGVTAIMGAYGAITGGITAFTDELAVSGDGIAASLSGAIGASSGMFDSVIGGTLELGDMITNGALSLAGIDAKIDTKGLYDTTSDYISRGFGMMGSWLGGIASSIGGFNDFDPNAPATQMPKGRKSKALLGKYGNEEIPLPPAPEQENTHNNSTNTNDDVVKVLSKVVDKLDIANEQREVAKIDTATQTKILNKVKNATLMSGESYNQPG